jgi:hypothetical protein
MAIKSRSTMLQAVVVIHCSCLEHMAIEHTESSPTRGGPRDFAERFTLARGLRSPGCVVLGCNQQLPGKSFGGAVWRTKEEGKLEDPEDIKNAAWKTQFRSCAANLTECGSSLEDFGT